jgi:hypothetical protein
MDSFMRKLAIVAGVLLLSLCGLALADDAPQTQPSVPATQPVPVNLADSAALTANMGKIAVVEGLVSDAKWSPSGKVFLIHFQEGDQTNFTGAFFAGLKDAMGKAFNPDLGSVFNGAQIQIVGKLQTFRDHPEILIHDPRQVMIIVKGPGKPASPAATQPTADTPDGGRS